MYLEGGFGTHELPPGACHDTFFGGDRPVRADVFGDGGYIGSFTYEGRQGANIRREDGPSFYSF